MELLSSHTVSASAVSRLLAELLKRRDRVLKFKGLSGFSPNLARTDALTLLFVLQGLGAVIVLSPKAFIYVGAHNVMKQFMSFISCRSDGKPVPSESAPITELSFPTGGVCVRGLQRLSAFVRRLVGELLLSSSHTLPKKEVVALAEQGSQEAIDRQLVDAGLCMLRQLNLLEWGEHTPNCSWQGPEFFNLLGLTAEDLPALHRLPGGAPELFLRWAGALRSELFNRELLYYRQLLLGDVGDDEFHEIIAAFERVETNATSGETSSATTGAEFGYAMLRGRRTKYFVQKLTTVVGRAPAEDSNVSWQVDIDLGEEAKVARQHALIVYNFHTSSFEIACLAEKKSVGVNGNRLVRGGGALPLENRTVIRIGREKLHFFLAK